MTETKAADPKLFISYSWTTPDHEAWVLQFAEELMSQGVHVILDKWDLQPGHDANAFMESMVTDSTVTKVLLICDEMYAKKSDGRKGGAGTEAQIITPEIYAHTAQDKFAAVVRERDADGKAHLPTYYKGRIYFDLTNPSTYSTEFDRILRWVWGQPLHVRPEIGQKPVFLTDNAAQGKIQSSVTHRRAMEAVRAGESNAVACVREYLDTIASGLETFRIRTDQDNKATFDDVVVESIDAFTSYRNEIIELFSIIAQYSAAPEMIDCVHRFFERCIPYLHTPENTSHSFEWDYDNYHFIVHELFLYSLGIFLKYERFDAAVSLIDTEYYWDDRRERDNKMHSYAIFRDYLRSLEHRNKRLDKRRLSLRADMLTERNKGTGVDFQYLMAADFILYLRAARSGHWQGWWPETLLYAGRHGGTFEVFARAKSLKYFNRIKGLLQIESKEEFAKFIEELQSDRQNLPSWEFTRVNPSALAGLSSLATTP